MNALEFDKISEDFLASLRAIQKSKGSEYCGSDDRFANFKRGAEAIGLTPETVLYIYMAKHWDSISNFIKKITDGSKLEDIEKGLSEPINGRLQDMVNYLLLLNGLIEERRKS